VNQIVCTPSKNSSARFQCRLLAYLSHIASLGTFWETRTSMDLHQLRRRICHAHHALLSSEQTGLVLIMDMLLHVIGPRLGTLSSSKTRSGRKKGTVKRTLLVTGHVKGTQSGWERSWRQAKEPRVKPKHFPAVVSCSLWPRTGILCLHLPCPKFNRITES